MKKQTDKKEQEPTVEEGEISQPAQEQVLEPATDATAATAEAGNTADVAQPKVYGDKILTPKQKRQRIALSWTYMFIGILMMSCSVYFFQTPNEFTMGGIAGVAIILESFLKPLVPFLTQGVIMAIINVFLLILGLIILGKQCTIKTIICSLFYTGFIWLFEYIDVIGLINAAVGRAGLATLTDQRFMELVYAILFFGVGGALVFNSGSSSGGTDIIALILKKYTKLNVGFALMLIDFIIVCISFYTFSIEGALFSLLGLFTKSFLLDSVIESMGKTKYITVITSQPELISDYILKVINHSFTMYDAEGGYSHQKKKVLITVCKRSEAIRLKIKIHNVDPTAFVIITDANEILGKGFGVNYQ